MHRERALRSFTPPKDVIYQPGPLSAATVRELLAALSGNTSSVAHEADKVHTKAAFKAAAATPQSRSTAIAASPSASTASPRRPLTHPGSGRGTQQSSRSREKWSTAHVLDEQPMVADENDEELQLALPFLRASPKPSSPNCLLPARLQLPLPLLRAFPKAKPSHHPASPSPAARRVPEAQPAALSSSSMPISPNQTAALLGLLDLNTQVTPATAPAPEIGFVIPVDSEGLARARETNTVKSFRAAASATYVFLFFAGRAREVLAHPWPMARPRRDLRR